MNQKPMRTDVGDMLWRVAAVRIVLALVVLGAFAFVLFGCLAIAILNSVIAWLQLP